MEDASFLIINLPFQLESLFDQDLSEQEQMIVSSIEKLNLLLYLPKEKQKEKYEKELVTISQILTQKRYQHLMDFRAFEKAEGSLLFEGSTDAVEEGIVFLKIGKKGFSVLRILGSDINPASLMNLVKKVDLKLLKKQLKYSIGSIEGLFPVEKEN
tara:strand:+ start:2907 stop:3374 length:468 start_codon:yes stop_codon:yes gene_type:complete